MSRIKNRGTGTISPYRKQAPVWRLGKYLRLSKDDFKRGDRDKEKAVSESINNQRKILDEFEQMHADEFEWSEEYKDDGFTGTDIDREDFQRLLADIRSGKVNCVIIKDLSRLSRDYVEAGILIDRLFVQMNVRFISLHERIDSYADPDSVSSIVVPITNVMNDQYCYQTSKKIRQVFDYKKRNGEFVGAFAPYGYVKNPNDNHALLIDEEAAGVVKQIFTMFLSGMTKRGIANHLNDHGILCPSAYKQSKGLKYQTPNGRDNPMWSTITIANLLKNPVYVGDLAQGRNRMKSYKIHKIEAVPEEDWIVVQNTHEAIIKREVFAQVKELLKRDTRTPPRKTELHLFSGFLKCADCGRAMSRLASNPKYVYYQCGMYKSQSKKACTMHSIKHEKLEAAVLYAIQRQVYAAVDCSEAVRRINKAPIKKNQSLRLNNQIAAKEKELAKVMRYKQSLYEDWKDGAVTRSDYQHMCGDYERQAETLQNALDNLTVERNELANGIDTENPFLVTFKKHENIDRLTREILIELVDHIKVYEGGDISIKFKFDEDYRRVTEYIEANLHSEVS